MQFYLRLTDPQNGFNGILRPKFDGFVKKPICCIPLLPSSL